MSEDPKNPKSVAVKTDRHGNVKMTNSELYREFIEANAITCLADDDHPATSISEESKVPAIQALGEYCQKNNKKGAYAIELPTEYKPFIEKYMKAAGDEERNRIWQEMKGEMVKVDIQKSQSTIPNMRMRLHGERQIQQQLEACAKFKVDVICMDEFDSYKSLEDRMRVNSVWADKIAAASKQYDKILVVGGSSHFSNQFGRDADELIAERTGIAPAMILLTADTKKPSSIRKGNDETINTIAEVKDVFNITINHNPKHFFTASEELNKAAEDLLEKYKRAFNTPVEGLEADAPKMYQEEARVRKYLENGEFDCFMEEYKWSMSTGKEVNGKFIPSSDKERLLAPGNWDDHFYEDGSNWRRFDEAYDKFKSVYFIGGIHAPEQPKAGVAREPRAIYNLLRSDGVYLIQNGVMTPDATTRKDNNRARSAAEVLGLEATPDGKGVVVKDMAFLMEKVKEYRYSITPVDEGAPKPPKLTPPVGDITPTPDKTTPPTEKVKSTQDKAVPPVKEVTPKQDEIVPPVKEIEPTLNKTTLLDEEVKPAQDKAKPSSEMLAAAPNKIAAAKDATAPLNPMGNTMEVYQSPYKLAVADVKDGPTNPNLRKMTYSRPFEKSGGSLG